MEFKYLIIFAGFLITWGAAVTSIVAIWVKFENKVENNNKDIKKLSDFFKKVLLDGNGEIRLVDKVSCKSQKIELQASIDDRADDIKEIRAEVRGMSDNVLLILYHLKIDKNKIIDLKRKTNDRP